MNLSPGQQTQAFTPHPISTDSGFGWKSLTLFLLTIVAVYLCLRMLQPFLPAITGAIVLAIVTYHPHRWIAARLRSPSIAAATSVALVTLGIIGPTFLLAQSFGYRVLAAIQAIQSGSAQRSLELFLDQSPRMDAIVQFSLDNVTPSQAFDKSAGFLTAHIAALLAGSLGALTQIVIMLFVLFFAYRDSDLALNSLRALVPLSPRETDHLFSRLVDTIRATVMGHFVVSAIQGVVAAIVFAFIGLPSAATLLGAATALAAIIPSFGAFVVWIPVAIYLALTHHWIQAAILMAVGTLIISTLDNVLYPIMVGTQLRLHTIPIFFSILGGVFVFGISGLILGPIACALAQSLLDIWRQRLTPAPTTPEQ